MDLQSIKALDELFVKLSDILGVTIDTIQANGMEYIMMYGKYKVIENFLGLPFYIICMLTIASIVFVILNVMDEIPREEIKIMTKLAVILVGFITIAFAIACFVPYLISPEMYSINEAIKLLN